MGMLQDLTDILERLNRVERWIERFGDTPRRVDDLYAKVVRASSGILIEWPTAAEPSAPVRGLGASFYKTVEPANVEYVFGIAVIQADGPDSHNNSIIPVRWSIPPKVGDVEPGIRFTWSDGTTSTRSNTTGSEIVESHGADLYFNQDGNTVQQIEFIVDNVGGTQTVDIAAFQLEGWQV